MRLVNIYRISEVNWVHRKEKETSVTGRTVEYGTQN